MDIGLRNDARILHLQTGGGLTGGVAGYVAILASSRGLKDFEFFVSVWPGESAHLGQSLKYGSAKLIEVETTYRFFGLPRVLNDIHKVLMNEGITLVHSHTLRAGFICAVLNLFCRTRFIHTNHGLRFSQKTGSIMIWVFYLLERFVVSRAECVCCVRPSDAKLVQKLFPQYAHKTHTIVTCLDSAKEAYTKAVETSSEPFRLVGVGTIIEVKGVDRFIDWLKALSLTGVNCEGVWLGDGPLRSVMELRAKNCFVEMQWLGNVDSETVAEELLKADVMLLTSKFEVLPLAALEAMSNFTPIVTTDFFGAGDFVQDQVTGLVLPIDVSPGQAAERILALLNDSALLLQMGVNARSHFLNSFSSVDLMTAEYRAQYTNILNSSIL